MTSTASFAVNTTDNASLPAGLEAELRLSTLAGSDNPLAGGGQLVRTISGATSANYVIKSGTNTFAVLSVLPPTLPSPVEFVLRTPAGAKLFELSLEIVDYTCGSSEDRVQVQVNFTGMTAEVAQSLSIDSASYTWRLSGVDSGSTSSVLKLAFDLVQEDVATEFVDPQASTTLNLTGGGAQMSAMKIKHSGVLVQPT